MPTLILLGGPPGAGKSSVLHLLKADIEVIDADEITMPGHPGEIEAVVQAARACFERGSDAVVIAWVFARPALFEPFIHDLADCYDSLLRIYLTASPAVIEKRLLARADQSKRDHDLAYALQKLAEIKALASPPVMTIDTSEKTPEAVYGEIVACMRGHSG